MKTLLRSMFVNQGEKPKLALHNFTAFLSAGLEFDVPEDQIIWNFILRFVRAHNHVPETSTLMGHFTHAGEEEVYDRVKQLSILKPKYQGDFEIYLTNKVNERKVRVTTELLKEASTILSTGMDIPGEKKGEIKHIKGPQSAIQWIMERGHDITAPPLSARLYGEVTHDGEDFVKEYETVEADPLAGIGQWCGLSQADEALSGAKRYELWTHAAFTGGMKCVTGDTRIFDLKTGKLRTVQDIYETGDAPLVHALDEKSWEMTQAQASPVVQNGERSIFRILSEKGRQIRVSGNHPFRTPEGWVNAEDLSVGEWVAVPGTLENDNQESPFLDEEVAAIGYLLGDGHIKNDISFTSGNPAILEDFVRCLEGLGYQESRAKNKARFPAYRHMAERPGSQMVRVSKSTGESPRHPWASPLRIRLGELGLWGCTAGDKHIPLEMWRMTDRQVWILLSALWATDGSISVDVSDPTRQPKPVSYYTTKSRQFAWDIQAILQRVGVACTVSPLKVKYKGEQRVYWTVLVTSNEGKRKFLSNVQVVGKEKAVAEALAAVPQGNGTDWVPPKLLEGLADTVRAETRKGGWHYAKWAKKKTKIQRDTLARLAESSGDSDLMRKAVGDIRWERIAENTPDGVEMTYDLSVPGPANFVANGFLTHNSTFMLNWAYSQAVYFLHPSLIFSLEMPYNQCRRILYAMHSIHDKFKHIRYELGLQQYPDDQVGLPYKAIRDGQLNDVHPNARQFLLDYVVPDFNGVQVIGDDILDPFSGEPWVNPEEYGNIHIEVADPDKSDFTVLDVRHRAEVLYDNSKFRTIFVDHMGLMAPRKWVSSTTERLNEVLRDLKKLAMNFNRGHGIAVMGLFQISREGMKSAEKIKEKTGMAQYNLTHLSYANEAERSSDVVTASWKDEDLAKQNRIQFQCLKTRDGEPFMPFLARIEWPCRRLLTCRDVIGNVIGDDPKQDAKKAKEMDDAMDSLTA